MWPTFPRTFFTTGPALARIRLVDDPMFGGFFYVNPPDRPSPLGFVLHAELMMMAEEGLTLLAVLRGATLDSAWALHVTDLLDT